MKEMMVIMFSDIGRRPRNIGRERGGAVWSNILESISVINDYLLINLWVMKDTSVVYLFYITNEMKTNAVVVSVVESWNRMAKCLGSYSQMVSKLISQL